MRLEISTLKRTISALGLSALLLVGMGSTAFAQRTARHYNRGRHLGWVRRDANRDRRLRRREVRTHQRIERRSLREQQRAARRAYVNRDHNRGGRRYVNQQLRQQRHELREHQRDERQALRGNNGNGRGHGRH